MTASRAGFPAFLTPLGLPVALPVALSLALCVALGACSILASPVAAQAVPSAQAAPSPPSVTSVPARATAVAEATPVATPATPPRVVQTSILLEVEGARSDAPVSVAFYETAESFGRDEDAVRNLVLDRTGPVTRAFVLGLPPGRYAVVVWQDVDADGKPTRGDGMRAAEPIAYSGQIPSAESASTGPDSGRTVAPTEQPAFETAAFDLGATGLTLRLSLP